MAIKHRPDLLRLIHDVTSGHADFKAILLYDVSRWGRFKIWMKLLIMNICARARACPCATAQSSSK